MKKWLSIMFSLVFIFALIGCKNNTSQNPERMKNSDFSSDTSSEEVARISLNSITFPAYQVENPQNRDYINEINNTAEFTVNVDFSENWTLKDSKGEETVPTGEFYTPLYIYDAEKLIGYIGFNRFEPYTDEIAQEQYYQTVYPNLRLSSMFAWDPYTAVKTTDISETGVADIWYLDAKEINNHPGAMPDVPSFETIGILSYDKELKVYIGIAFMPETVDKAQAESIAKTVSLSLAE